MVNNIPMAAAGVAFALLMLCMPAHAQEAPSLTPAAEAADAPKHPLTNSARVFFQADLAKVFKAVGEGEGLIRATAFSGKLAEKLLSPLNRPQMIWYPSADELGTGIGPASDEFVVGAIVPPGKLYPTSTPANPSTYADVPVCADQNGKVLWHGSLNAVTGRAVESKDPVPAVDADSRACRGWLKTEGNKMVLQLGQLQADSPK